jgi:4-hydroxy-3-methylbut-2-enyl diphosphate reductase
MAALYIWAMHVLNQFLDRGASTYNEPDQAHFYKTHRTRLMITGLGAVAIALVLAWSLGHGVLLAMAGVSALGVVYGIPIVPVRRDRQWSGAKIKDIPGSKTLAESLAWGVVIALIPLLEVGRVAWAGTLEAFVFVVSVVYVRSALFDVFRVQGYLIVGVETLPITIGERRTIRLLKTVLAGCGVVLLVAGLSATVPSFSYLLLLPVASLGLTIFTYEHRWLYPGHRLATMVEANLLLAGLLGLLWQAVA